MSAHSTRKRKLPEDKEDNEIIGYDHFSDFINRSLNDADREILKQQKKLRQSSKTTLPGIGNAAIFSGINSVINENLTPGTNSWNEDLTKNFNSLQQSLSPENQTYYNCVSQYMDLLAYPSSKDYRNIYMAHVLHHILRTRNTVIHNKQRLQTAEEKNQVTEELIESMRDQGFVRPTVLILCPFKKDAYDLMERLKVLVFGDSKPNIMKADRFETEFSSLGIPEFDSSVDEETRELLSGNNDDCFRLGIALTKKTLKLFEPFDRSDILLCSPLGLRMILEKEGEEETHLISSINITVLDMADIMLQQNWQNVTLIVSKLLQQPSKINADISRVRQYFLDGDSKYFHQFLTFAKHSHELISALVYQESLNHRGLVISQPLQEGTLDSILIPLCQELHKFDCKATGDQSDSRFEYFKNQILPTLKPHTCVFIPSYFDFVRIRNHMKRMEESFVACHEYADKNKINRAKDMFYHERKSILLVTERYYYFNRRRIRGIDQMVFYQLPSHPKFYSDFINMARDQKGIRFKAILLYTKYDRTRLENTFGTDMAVGILSSKKAVQAIVSE